MPIPLPETWTPRTLPALRRALLAWFESHHRDLPWRANRDPYRIWVSEIMLQQTTVAAVVPYFERFLAAFPTVKHLAAADEPAVLKLWQGLGYYRRARHLHAAARELVAGHGDSLPDDPEVWANLPGVGRYVLGAVLSQAFDRKLPIVEANTLRVYSRWFGFLGDPRTGPGQKWVWAAAETAIPNERVGEFNQAAMELGSLVCTPRSPNCGKCPVAKWCVANRDGTQDRIPLPKAIPAKTLVREVAVAVRAGDAVLLVQRPTTAKRWAGLWELPHGEVQSGESDAAAAERMVRESTGISVAVGPHLVTVKHGITRYSVTLVCHSAKRIAGEFRPGSYAAAAWVKTSDLDEYPTSSPQRKLLKLMGPRDSADGDRI